MYAYVFLVGFDEDGPHTDCFLDVSAALGFNPQTYQLATDTAKRLGIPTGERVAFLGNMAGISLRARVTGKRMHKVTTEEPITAEVLDSVLRNKQFEGKLKSFLKESEI
jgi:hypothetical protein